MVETKYGKCPICGVEISGYGLDDLNKNIKAHIEQQHPNEKYTIESESVEVKEEEVKEEEPKKKSKKKKK